MPVSCLFHLLLTLSCLTALTAQDRLVTRQAGPDWRPLLQDLEIEPGSVLDLSDLVPDRDIRADGPLCADAHGRLIEKATGRRVRLWGTNLTFGNALPDETELKALVPLLRRQGYNAVRLHHFERELYGQTPVPGVFAPGAVEKLDALTHQMGQHGLRYTIDLYASRPYDLSATGVAQGEWLQLYKYRMAVDQTVFRNWCDFATALLTHANPNTGRRLADDPALVSICLINEGNFFNLHRLIVNDADWKQAWNAWLMKTYSDRAGLVAAWPEELAATEDPTAGTVSMINTFWGAPQARRRDNIRFLEQMQADLSDRMLSHIRSIGTHALLTNVNGWIHFQGGAVYRQRFDLIDDHFYVCNPDFLVNDWRVPAIVGNADIARFTEPGGRASAFLRHFGKPMTISEYNFCPPDSYRGGQGLWVGALAAVQDWDGVFQFCWHGRAKDPQRPVAIGFLSGTADPVSKAAQRAIASLYLRGDMRSATAAVAIVSTPEDLAHPPIRPVEAKRRWLWAALLARLGNRVVDAPTAMIPEDLAIPLAWKTSLKDWTAPANAGIADGEITDAVLLRLMKERGLIGPANPTDPAALRIQTDDGALRLDGTTGTFVVDTPLTCGVVAQGDGDEIVLRGGAVGLRPHTAWGTACLISRDGKPVESSCRLLLDLMTDVANTGLLSTWQNETLRLDMGKPPLLLRRAGLAVRLMRTTAPVVRALDQRGRPIGAVQVRRDGPAWILDLENILPDGTPVMSWEITFPAGE